MPIVFVVAVLNKNCFLLRIVLIILESPSFIMCSDYCPEVTKNLFNVFSCKWLRLSYEKLEKKKKTNTLVVPETSFLRMRGNNYSIIKENKNTYEVKEGFKKQISNSIKIKRMNDLFLKDQLVIEDYLTKFINNTEFWLQCMRLHKYVDCFKGLSLFEITNMNSDELFHIGVCTMGARKKILRESETIKDFVQKNKNQDLKVDECFLEFI